MTSVYRVEKYAGFYETKWDPTPRDHFVYLGPEGEWVTKKGEACQFTSWNSANDVSKNLTNATVVMSEVIGSQGKKVEKKVSATQQAAKEAKKLTTKKAKVEKKATKKVAEGPSKSQQIRDMAAQGMSKSAIAKALDVRYQMVFKVLKDMKDKEANTQLAADVDVPEDFEELDEEEPQEEDTADREPELMETT